MIPSPTAQGHKRNVLFHPNVNGYKARTAALVQFSNTPVAQGHVVRNMPAVLEVIALPAAPSIRVETLGSSTLQRGQPLTVVASGLQPGTAATLVVQSVPQLMASSAVAADGTATLTFDLVENFDTGDHTFILTGVDADGALLSRSYPVVIDDREPFWAKHGPLIALTAATFAVSAQRRSPLWSCGDGDANAAA